jgi:hypothetical protein
MQTIQSLVVLIVLGSTSLALAAQPKPSELAVRLADLDVAEREYVNQAPSFSATARQAADALLRAMRSTVASMSDAQFALTNL